MSFLDSNKSKLFLTTAATAIVLSVSMTAQAQDAPDDEIIVTGIRQSLEESTAIKKDSSSIVDAISAEDIGKLPDISITESLARLPGIAAQRVRGRAQTLSIRGLGPDFTTALLNGREQVTSGDNRGVEFDQYPAELLSSAVVYKTPDAALLGAGMAGTVDLRTIRPLEYRGDSRVVLNGRYEYNDQGKLNSGSDAHGYRFNGTYIGTNKDDTLGWMIGGTIQKTPNQNERWEAWGGDGYPTLSSGEYILGGAKPYVESRNFERQSVVGTLQYEPTDALSVTGDVFYSHFEDGGILRGIELPLFWSAAALQPGYTVDNNLVTEGTFNGVEGVIRNDVRSREADMLNLGLNVGYEFSEKWSGKLDVSRSQIDRDDRDLETYSSHIGNENLAFAYNNSTGSFVFNPNVDYSDTNNVLLAPTWNQAGFIKEPKIKDELTALRGSLYRNIEDPLVSGMEIGLNYTTRKKTKDSEESFLDLANPDANGRLAIPSEYLLSPTNLEFLGLGNMVSYDPNRLLSDGVYNLRPNTGADVITKAWEVKEDVITGYAKFDLDRDTGNSIPMKGNVGLQWVYTDQSSKGYASNGAEVGEVKGGDTYLDILPSANLTFEIADDAYLRLAAAKTISRSRMEQMKASQQIGLNSTICSASGNGNNTYNEDLVNYATRQTCINGSGGNPTLRPFESVSFDASLEKYFHGNEGYVSGAFYYKSLDDFIFDGVTTQSSNGFGLVDFTAAANSIFGADFVAANPSIVYGFSSRPENADGGWMRGVELATNLPGSLLTDVLEGFGVYASYTYNDSEIKAPNKAEATEIPGLSKSIYNLSGYYERYGFQARLNVRHRDKFLAEVVGFGANTETRNVDGETILDGQIGYEFQSGALEGLSLIAQGYNLTNEEYKSVFSSDKRLVKDWQKYGRLYMLSVGYKF